MQSVQVVRADYPTDSNRFGADLLASNSINIAYAQAPQDVVMTFDPVRVGGVLSLERLTVESTLIGGRNNLTGTNRIDTIYGIRGYAQISGQSFAPILAEKAESWEGIGGGLSEVLPIADAVLPTITVYPNQQIVVRFTPFINIERFGAYDSEVNIFEMHFTATIIGDLQRSTNDTPF